MESGNYSGTIPYESSGASQAYGSSGASGQFDPKVFIRKNQVIARLCSLCFSVVVFSCISSKGWEKNHCAYGNDPGACGYGIAVAVLAFLILIVFLVLDALFDNISNILHRKYIVIADILVSGAWTFLYFVSFCYLTDKWRNLSSKDKEDYFANWNGDDTVQAAIAFTFFSIISFGLTTVLAVLRYRQGVPEVSSGGYNSDPFSHSDGFTP